MFASPTEWRLWPNETQPKSGDITFNNKLVTLIATSIFCIPFVAAGAYVARQGLRTINAAQASTHWPRVAARLEHCAVTETDDGDGGTRYDVEVRYRYERAGTVCTSTRLSFGTVQAGSKSSAEALCARLKIETDLYASVNPHDPSDAVLLPGSALIDYVPIVFGVTFAGFAIMFVAIVALQSVSPTGVERIDQAQAADGMSTTDRSSR